MCTHTHFPSAADARTTQAQLSEQLRVTTAELRRVTGLLEDHESRAADAQRVIEAAQGEAHEAGAAHNALADEVMQLRAENGTLDRELQQLRSANVEVQGETTRLLAANSGLQGQLAAAQRAVAEAQKGAEVAVNAKVGAFVLRYGILVPYCSGMVLSLQLFCCYGIIVYRICFVWRRLQEMRRWAVQPCDALALDPSLLS